MNSVAHADIASTTSASPPASKTRIRVATPLADEARQVRLFSAHAVRWLHRAAGVERGYVASPAHIARRVFTAIDPSGLTVNFVAHRAFYYAELSNESIAWACGALAVDALQEKFLRELGPLMRAPGDHKRLARAVEKAIARRLVRDFESAEVPS